MKKLTSFLLLLSLVMIVGCNLGNNDDNNDNDSNTTSNVNSSVIQLPPQPPEVENS